MVSFSMSPTLRAAKQVLIRNISRSRTITLLFMIPVGSRLPTMTTSRLFAILFRVENACRALGTECTQFGRLHFLQIPAIFRQLCDAGYVWRYLMPIVAFWRLAWKIF